MRRAINSIVYDLTGSASNQFVSMLTIIGKAYKIITRTFFKVMSTHLILKRSFTYFCIYALIFAPWMSLRAETGITVDPNASAANQSIMDKTANNTPLQNIATPNAAGLSHNKFLKFNVGKKGLVVNNSKALTTSTHLGGIISANPNLKNSNAATIILNEVNGSARTNLLGPTEIAGQRADYIVANPNGISCNGCGFINTPRATLSTGVPELDSNGMLKSFNVNRGDVIISGSGLNALGQGDVTGADIVDIVARQIKINADATLQAKELNIIAGRNQVDYETREAVAKADNGTSVDNAIEIDSSLLGGMYADKITIVATEAGVGVRNDGTMSAGIGGLTLSADGKISINNRIESKANINMASHSSDIEIYGTTYAKDNLEVESKRGTVSVADKSTVASGKNVVVNANSVDIKQGSTILSGLNPSGTLNTTGDLSINATQRIDNAGTLLSAGKMALTAVNGLGNSGKLSSQDNLSIQTNNSVSNSGEIVTNKALIIDAANQITNDGEILAGKTTTLNANTLTTGNQSKLLAQQDLGIYIIDNIKNLGDIGSNDAVTITSNNLSNDGAITANDTLDVTTGDIDMGTGSRLIATGTLNLNANGNITNDGKIASNDVITINSKNITNSSNGELTTLKDLYLNASGHVVNRGLIGANAQLDITQATSLDNSGKINAGATKIILADDVINDGELLASKTLSINADTLTTSNQSKLLAEDALDITITNDIVNQGDIGSNDAVTIISNNLSNNGTITANDTLAVTTGDVEMGTGSKLIATGTLKLDANGNITSDGQIGSNDAVVINAMDITNGNNGQITAVKDLDLNASGHVINQGLIGTNGKLDMTRAASLNNSGRINAGATKIIVSDDFVNDGELLASKTMSIKADTLTTGNQSKLLAENDLDITITGDIVNQGEIGSNDAITISSNNLRNDGTISANDTLAVNTGDVNMGTGSQLIASGRLNIDANGNIISDGKIASNDAVTVNSKNITNNENGEITAVKDLYINASGHVVNQGLIGTNGQLDITQATSLDNSGKINAGATKIIVTDNVINDGEILSSSALSLNADSLTIGNQSKLLAEQAMDITITGDIKNQGDIGSNQAVTILSNNLSNDGAISSDDVLTVTTGNLEMGTGSKLISTGQLNIDANGNIISDGQIASNDTVNINTNNITNGNNGVITAVKDLFLNALGHIINQGLIATNDQLDMTKAISLDNSGQIKAGATKIIVTDNVINDGEIISGKTLTLNADTLDTGNQSKLLAEEAMEINIAGDIEHLGEIGSNQALTIISNNLRNDGAISAGDTLTVTGANINMGTGSKLVATNALDVDANGNIVSDGQIASNDSITINTKDMTNNGEIIAGSSLVLNAATLTTGAQSNLLAATSMDVDITGDIVNLGKIGSNQRLSIASANLRNAGTISSDDTLSIATGNVSMATGAKILSSKTQQLTASGSIISDGKVASNEQLIVKADTVTNQQNGQFSAVGDLSITTNSTLENQGEMITNGSLTIAASDVQNSDAVLAAGKQLTITTAGNIDNNNGLLFSVEDMNLSLNGNIDNTNGDIESFSNLTIEGETSSSPLKIVKNISGNIRAGGNLLIRADQIDNKPEGGVTVKTVTTSKWYPVISSHPTYRVDGFGVWVESDAFTKGAIYFRGVGSAKGFGGITYYIKEDTIAGSSSNPSLIFAGGDIDIYSPLLNNQSSSIQARGDISLTGTTLNNQGVSLRRQELVNCNYRKACFYNFSGSQHDRSRQFGGTRVVANTVGSSLPGIIEAGGDLSINYNTINQNANATITGGTVLTSPGTPALPAFFDELTQATQVELSETDINIDTSDTTAVSTTDLDTVDGNSPAIATADLDLEVSNNTNTNLDITGSTLSDVTTADLDSVINNLSTSSDITIDKDTNDLINSIFDSKFFQPAPPASEFKFETRYAFIDEGSFYGSKYFLSRLQSGPGGNGKPYDINKIPKRLCDAFCETRYINDDIRNKLGPRLIYGESETEQYKHLLDNGIAASEELDLELGIALAEEQINELLEPIVWYVAVNIDGDSVLVPKVYLSPDLTIESTQDTQYASRLKGNNTYVNVKDFSNTGLVAAIGGLEIISNGTVVNEGGEIRAGANLDIRAEHNIVNRTMIARIGDAINYGRVIESQGKIRAGGDITLASDATIENLGSTIESNGDLTITAKNDVIFDAQAESMKGFVGNKKRWNKLAETRHLGSQIDSDGNLTLQSGEDIALTSTHANAVENITLDANNDIIISARTDKFYNESYEKSRGLFTKKSSHQIKRHETQIKSMLAAGNNINLNSGENIAILASDITADGNITLASGQNEDGDGGDIDILSGSDKDYAYLRNKKSGFGLFTGGDRVDFYRSEKTLKESDQVVNVASKITAAGDVTILSAENVTVIGSKVLADNDINITAVNNVNLTPGTAISNTRREKEQKSFGINYGADENGFTLGGGLSEIDDRTSLEQENNIASVLSAGNDVTIVAGEDINHVSSLVQALNNVNLQANNINSIAVQDISRFRQYHKDKQIGVQIRLEHGIGDTIDAIEDIGNSDAGATGTASNTMRAIDQVNQTLSGPTLEVFAGVSGKTQRLDETTGTARSSLISAGNDINATAEKEIKLVGTQAVAGRDIVLQAEDVTIDVAENSFKRDYDESSFKAGVTARSGGNSASIGIGASVADTTQDVTQTIGRATKLEAGRDIVVVATEDIVVRGAQIKANEDITLDAGNDLSIIASQGTYEAVEDTVYGGGEIGIEVGGSTGLGIYVSAHGGFSDLDENKATQTNSSVRAGETLRIESGADTTIAGANLHGKNVESDIGGELVVASIPDIGEVDGQKLDVSGKVSIGISGGVSGSISVGYGETKGNTNWVAKQTTVTADESLDLKIEDNTHIDAALINSESGDLNLDTGTLTYQHFDGVDKERSTYASVSIGTTSSDNQLAGSSSAEGDNDGSSWGFEFQHEEREKRQALLATVGPGEITIRNEEQQKQNLASLNRDPNKAYRITKDDESKIDIYLTSTSRDAIVNYEATLKRWKNQILNYDVTFKGARLSVTKELYKTVIQPETPEVAARIDAMAEVLQQYNQELSKEDVFFVLAVMEKIAVEEIPTEVANDLFAYFLANEEFTNKAKEINWEAYFATPGNSYHNGIWSQIEIDSEKYKALEAISIFYGEERAEWVTDVKAGMNLQIASLNDVNDPPKQYCSAKSGICVSTTRREELAKLRDSIGGINSLIPSNTDELAVEFWSTVSGTAVIGGTVRLGTAIWKGWRKAGKQADNVNNAPNKGTGNPGEYLDDFKPSPTPVELIKNAGKQGQKTASIRFDHILDGNINSIGRGTGGHYLRSDNIRLKEITKTVDSKGVQTGYIQVRDPSTGRWVDKSDPSSFYPEHWSRRQTVQEIESAFKNSSPVPGTDRWRGKSPSGVTIEGYYTKPDGGAATAWPVQGG